MHLHHLQIVLLSFRMPTVVTQYEHHVQEEKDTDDVIEDPEPKVQVPDSIAAYTSLKEIYENLLVFRIWLWPMHFQ